MPAVPLAMLFAPVPATMLSPGAAAVPAIIPVAFLFPAPPVLTHDLIRNTLMNGRNPAIVSRNVIQGVRHAARPDCAPGPVVPVCNVPSFAVRPVPVSMIKEDVDAH